MEFTAKQATGPVVVAPALVTRMPFSARYDLDRTTGVISRNDHELRGESIAGRVLVTRGVQGGVAAGWALLALAARKCGFAGMVFGDTNPVMVQGAVAAGIPVFAGIDPEFFDVVRTGDTVELDPAARLVRIVPAA
ncbi:aconitase X swivel domain-containing protein [Amycolatopsis jejuensis]|uniref:aconitase X swivel domain-containing protein n=1 Tax=Amycolatopsis jejuensis TaxID=330084 RepID=UPI000524BEEF|nr:DUF126 domain-containing protein [Amycolatopsis jejuensis]